MPRTSEPEVNIALGEVLRSLRPTSWSVRTEPIGAIHDSAKRPDILIADPAGWPVAVEGEWAPAATVEADAIGRLGLRLTDSGLDIETAIAVIYPLELNGLGHDYPQLRGDVDPRHCHLRVSTSLGQRRSRGRG